MERLLAFDIAKKIAKPAANAAGLMLRSASGDSTKIVLLISTGGRDGNDRVRAAASDYRLRSGKEMEYAVRGKSVEAVFEGEGAVASAIDFMSGLSFVSEEINEIVEFFGRYSASRFGGQVFEPIGLDADEGAFRIKLSLLTDDETADEAVYEAIMPALNEYNMGIVKGNS